MTRCRLLFVLAISCFALFASAAPFTGPTSPYYLDSWSSGQIFVVQGTSVTNSWLWHYPSPGPYQEAMLTVTNTVRTTPFYSYGSGRTSGQYTLAGTPTGVTYAEPATPTTPDYAFDATSDGTSNYYVQFDNGTSHEDVIKTNLDWSSPTVLFSLPLTDYSGIAYDSTNSSLWIVNYDSTAKSVVADYDLSGHLLSSFVASSNGLGSLGLDPADHTLWATYLQSTLLAQYSTSGVLLQSGSPTGLSGTIASGEFVELGAQSEPAVPEPTSLLLLGSGFLLLLRRKLCK